MIDAGGHATVRFVKRRRSTLAKLEKESPCQRFTTLFCPFSRSPLVTERPVWSARWALLLVTTLPLSPALAGSSPDLELLEFLGQWQEEAQGQWLDPLAMTPLLDEEKSAPQPQQSQEEPDND